jgi:hypothetical protein
MNLFPLEIVNLILQYAGRIKYRNGKFMNQIYYDDSRYNMLKRMPKITMYYGLWYMSIISSSNKKFYFEKRKSSYLGEEPLIIIKTTDTVYNYTFITQGICYKWIIFKPFQKPPSMK